MSKAKITKEDIQHLAKLANLQTEESEVESLSQQLDETIAYIENLNELNTDKIESSLENIEKNRGFEDGETNLRQLPQEEALKGSKNRKGKYFVVSRLM